jgi:hypothetical protein
MLASRGRRKVQATVRPAVAGRGRAVLVNGLPGIVSWREDDGTPLSVVAFTITDGRITASTAAADPAKLASRDLPDPAGPGQYS